jgi:hypothetical protein
MHTAQLWDTLCYAFHVLVFDCFADVLFKVSQQGEK